MDFLWIIENQRSKNPEMNTSEKIFKLTYQLISKSAYLYINRKLTTREFQRDKNWQIPICILGVIDPASQCPNSDWKWTVVGQTLNWGVKWTWNFMNLLSTESSWNKEFTETESSDSESRSEGYPIFKISKNSNRNWVKLKNTKT